MILNNACQQVQPKIQNTDDCKESYYREFLKGWVSNDYTLAVNAKYAGESFSILLDRSQLRALLDTCKSHADSMNVKSYLTQEKPLVLNDQDINGVIIIRSWKSVDAVAQKGKEETLNYFFKNRRMQSRYVSSPERDYLIKHLNEWCILTFVDDETGFIKIKEVN